MIKGELDWIVMKAMEKDRNRRYETVNGFVADVERHLADEPVVAGPPSVTYKAKSFARRHRVLIASSGLIAAALDGHIGARSGAREHAGCDECACWRLVCPLDRLGPKFSQPLMTPIGRSRATLRARPAW